MVKLSTRLTVTMVGLVLFTAVAVGLLMYHHLRGVVPEAKMVSAVGRPLLLGGLAGVVAAIVLAAVLGRSLTRPLARITAAVEAMSRGELMPVPGTGGGEEGVLARALEQIARDLTAQKRAAEKFRLAVESAPSGMIMVDRTGTIVLVNAEAERLFGYTREELVGSSVDRLVPEGFREGHKGYRDAYAVHPGKRPMGAGRDLYGLRKDGSEFPVEIGLNPIQTSEGLFVLSVIVDITARREAEQALARRTEELQRSNADLEQFAYVASHDLQEPLRMVVSYSELLAARYQGQLDEKADKYIRYAVQGARRMQQLINDLLTYSRVDTQGKRPQPTDAGRVVEHVLDGMRTTIEESGARIDCEKLPTVRADEVQLRQVFQNLIGNAIKFRSERPPVIRIGAEPEGDRWRFTVQDNGIGIEAGYEARVFQMFQRLHDREKYEGNGIGLAIAKKIVERHGGRIWFDSRPGEGTSFHFTMRAG